jgi:hypothetical protein
VAGVGRQAADVQVERGPDGPAGRPDRAQQLQVLEQHVAVVAAGVQDQRAAHPQGAGEVAAADPVEQGPRRVEAGVPGQGIEVVLRPDQVGSVQQLDQPRQRRRGVADVVVGQHHRLVAGRGQAGQDPVDLAVAIVQGRVGPQVGHPVAEGAVVGPPDRPG